MAARIPDTSPGDLLRFSVENTLSTPVQDVIEFVGAALIDFTRVAEAATASVAAISIQDNANVARQRSSFDLAQQSTLVNPVEKSQQLRGPSSAKNPLLHGRVVNIDQGGASWWVESKQGST
jgi:hypothetical protein